MTEGLSHSCSGFTRFFFFFLLKVVKACYALFHKHAMLCYFPTASLTLPAL